MNKQELNERRAKWAGFRWQEPELIRMTSTSKGIAPITKQAGWIRPDSSMGITPDELFKLPDFPHDETACFRWLVPKGNIRRISFAYGSNGVDCVIETYSSPRVSGWVTTESIEESWQKTAQALCKATDKLIDSEVKP